jgi:hypothetical protein
VSADQGNGAPEEPGTGASEPRVGGSEPQTPDGPPEPATTELRSVPGGAQAPFGSPPSESAAGGVNGRGPDGELGAFPAEGQESAWQRPEVALGAAFVGGLLLAVLFKRGRS